jgi:anti-sigma factor RsiW
MPDERLDRHGDDDAGMGRLLRERLPRHPPPAHLRAAIVAAVAQTTPRRRWASWLLPPLASAFATALIMILAIAPLLPPSTPADPLRLVSQAVVSEHARSILWGETRGDVVPAALPRAMQEGGVEFNWVFTGDDRIQLVNAQPTYVDGRRGVELDYRDADGHTITYIVLSARTLALPERGRVQIDRWRPLVRSEGGFSLIIWKQQELLCVLVADLVSDADLSRLKEYFVKVRSSTEPYALN